MFHKDTCLAQVATSPGASCWMSGCPAPTGMLHAMTVFTSSTRNKKGSPSKRIHQTSIKLLYTIIYYYILLYTIIYYYILLYTIIYYYILLYTIINVKIQEKPTKIKIPRVSWAYSEKRLTPYCQAPLYGDDSILGRVVERAARGPEAAGINAWNCGRVLMSSSLELPSLVSRMHQPDQEHGQSSMRCPQFSSSWRSISTECHC